MKLSLGTAVILGVEGQDGYYLALQLLNRGYSVVGTVKKKNRIPQVDLIPGIHYVELDIRDKESFRRILIHYQPSHIYNLAGKSSVSYSFSNAQDTFSINYFALSEMLRVLEEIDVNRSIRFFQASSSEMFGNQIIKLNENSELNPVSPYGESKAAAHILCQEFRKNFDLKISCGILFNHESERRSPDFVTRKITRSVAQIKLGLLNKIDLGDLSIVRDWGYAPDYTLAMCAINEAEFAEDYVVATGSSYSLQDIVETAFISMGYEGDVSSFINIKDNLLRKNDIQTSFADPSKISKSINWKHQICFKDLITRMVKYDLHLLSNNLDFGSK
jgi:GDPmannose 4,6-dehydratase